jgi:hypothetical protein
MKKHMIRKYESIGAMYEHAAQDGPAGKRRTSQEKEAGTFAGPHTWAEMPDLVKYGWQDQVALIENMAANIMEKVTDAGLDTTYTVAWDVSGGFVDVAAHLSGVAECMGEAHLVPKPATVLRLLLSVDANGWITADYLIERGAVILALCEVARRIGISTEVWVAIGSGGANGAKYETATLVKRADDPTDLAALAYALAHPSVLRRLSFGCMEVEANDPRFASTFSVPGGYGRSIPPSSALAKEVGADLVTRNVLGPGNDPETRDPVAWIRSTLEGFGVTFD